MDTYDIRPLQPGDETSLLETFNLVFGANDPAFVPRTLAEWRWAFERNPAGQRVFVALHAGRVVAQYAALPVRMWIGGTERVFAQIVDSMVHPEHRSSAARSSLFVETARAFFAHYGGPAKDLVHFGWPTARALRVGERELGYTTLRTQLVLLRELETPRAAAEPRASPAVELAQFDHQAKWLWERCADSYRASAIRDAAYLNWRFVEHPGRIYVRHGVSDSSGVLRGVCCARRAELAGRKPWVIADWLVPPDEPAVGESLLDATLRSAGEAGASEIAVLVPEWSAWFHWFQEHGFLAQATPYRTIARPFHPRFDLNWLRSNWWYQLGDSDLV